MRLFRQDHPHILLVIHDEIIQSPALITRKCEIAVLRQRSTLYPNCNTNSSNISKNCYVEKQGRNLSDCRIKPAL
jgi:hypothetical protein